MIVDLSPETYFQYLNDEANLHVVLCYGETCGPCKITLPHYEDVAKHFYDYGITKVRFYKFHQWQPEYKPFIAQHKLDVPGVPTIRAYFYGDVLWEKTAVFQDPNALKAEIVQVIEGIQKTMEFSLQ